MRRKQQTMLISAAVAFSISCSDLVKIPSPSEFPHNWLQKKLDSKEIDRLRSHGLPASMPRDSWDSFLAKLLPGDEIWRWEYPAGSNMYPDKIPYGCCIVRGGKIMVVFKVGDLVWVD